MASLGLPGLGNFVAEFLTLVGAWQATHKLTIVATIGLVAATIYSLRILQKVFYGIQSPSIALADLSLREKLVMLALVASIVWLGLFPQPVLNTSHPSVNIIVEADGNSTGRESKQFQSTKVSSAQREGSRYE